MKRTADRLFGDAYVWSVLGAGRHQTRLVTTAAIMGGNVRVGLEDSLYLERGTARRTNADQVAKIVPSCASSLEIATPDEARERLASRAASTRRSSSVRPASRPCASSGSYLDAERALEQRAREPRALHAVRVVEEDVAPDHLHLVRSHVERVDGADGGGLGLLRQKRDRALRRVGSERWSAPPSRAPRPCAARRARPPRWRPRLPARASAQPRAVDARLVKTTLPLWMYVATSSQPASSNTRRRSAIAILLRAPRLMPRAGRPSGRPSREG